MPNKVRIALIGVSPPAVVGDVRRPNELHTGAKAYAVLKQAAQLLLPGTPPSGPMWRTALYLYQRAPAEFRQQFSLHISRVPRRARTYYYRQLLRQFQSKEPRNQWQGNLGRLFCDPEALARLTGMTLTTGTTTTGNTAAQVRHIYRIRP